jgi:hypothetical protein
MSDTPTKDTDQSKPQAEEIEPLTDEDEAILDAVWARIALQRKPNTPTDAESEA